MKNNFVNYVIQYREKTFEEMPFNEVDNLVFSELVYYNLEGIVPPDGEEISIREAYEKFRPEGEKRTIIGRFLIHPVRLFGYMAASKRFKNCRLSYYVGMSDGETTQFAALKIRINDEMNYIAFRGTDGTMHGWREDFAISYTVTPSQKLAVKYLNKVIETGKRNIIGGHSKGGLLALYGAVKCREELKQEIMNVYSNDGPGIDNKWLDAGQYALLRDKIVKIVPQHSIVGMLFNNDTKIKVVRTSKRGFFQHYMDHWVIEGVRLKEGRLSRLAKWRQETLEQWIAGVSLADREHFVEGLFGCFTAGGINNWTQFANQGMLGYLRFAGLLIMFLLRSGSYVTWLIRCMVGQTKTAVKEKILRYARV